MSPLPTMLLNGLWYVSHPYKAPKITACACLLEKTDRSTQLIHIFLQYSEKQTRKIETSFGNTQHLFFTSPYPGIYPPWN